MSADDPDAERRHGPEPMDTLYGVERGERLPLSPALTALYGRLGFAPHPGRPYVVANFVTTLDGVVAFDIPGRPGGGDISGHNPHDRAVMGLLRAVADAIVVGAGTLRAEPRHIWTAEHIFPALAVEYAALRSALGKAEPPLNVLVTARGDLDLDLPIFQSGAVPVLLITTAEGERQLRARAVPATVRIAAVRERGSIGARAILEAVRAVRPSDVILVEGGPHLLGDFLAARQLDEQFLTLAPQIAGRDAANERPGLVMGTRFAPDTPLWGTLISVKRAGSHLFLRYAFDLADDTTGEPAR